MKKRKLIDFNKIKKFYTVRLAYLLLQGYTYR